MLFAINNKLKNEYNKNWEKKWREPLEQITTSFWVYLERGKPLEMVRGIVMGCSVSLAIETKWNCVELCLSDPFHSCLENCKGTRYTSEHISVKFY